MRKIYFLLVAVLCGLVSRGQTVTNAGMELWRNSTAGTTPVVATHAPINWFGLDSLVIAAGESGLGDTTFVAQVFQDSVKVNSGRYSAKVVSLFQDTTLGILPGTLTNAQPNFNLFIYLSTMDPKKAITFTGGEPVTLKITTVSAYVAYFPGKDTATHTTALDTGSLFVQAYGVYHGVDTLLGTGIAQILPSAGFVQVTANIAYTDTVDSVGLIRMFFASSGDGTNLAVDSSTLYVDDVSMTGVPEPPPPIVVDTDTVKAAVTTVAVTNAVKVFPNPAIGAVYVDGPQNALLNCKLYSINGQVVAEKSFTGKGSIDISCLPSGLYFYTITDDSGHSVQRGKLVVSSE